MDDGTANCHQPAGQSNARLRTLINIGLELATEQDSEQLLLPGIAFLHKPFTSETLGRKIREVLDR